VLAYTMYHHAGSGRDDQQALLVRLCSSVALAPATLE
jgi:hypothetical protein